MLSHLNIPICSIVTEFSLKRKRGLVKQMTNVEIRMYEEMANPTSQILKCPNIWLDPPNRITPEKGRTWRTIRDNIDTDVSFLISLKPNFLHK